jgi:uncharacterized MAPEG superfamily protein
MTVAEWCLFGALLLALLTVAPVKPLGWRDFDNAKPRDPQFYAATPLRTRALGAHLNGLETFPFFAAAILLAEFRGVAQASIDLLAIAFLVIRLAYVLAYLGNRPWLRTALWNLGFLANAAIFFSPAFR